MSERRTICPHCERPPGGVHADECPRGRVMHRRLADACREALKPRSFWIFGSQIVNIPDEGEKITFNPGVPYVRHGRPWWVGGKPHDMKRKNEGFIRHMNAAREKLLALKAQEARDVDAE